MPETTGPEETEAFARLLRELKDRSGLSYGTLAKRLHMSTSTLHRYCNGAAVPADYAPVERLARVCRATPQELVELHRNWILADAARGRTPERPAAPRSGETTTTAAGTDVEVDAEAGAGPQPEAPNASPHPTEGPHPSVAPLPDVGPLSGDVPPPPPPSSPARRRRRTALIASAALATVAAVVGAVVLAVNPPGGGHRSTADGRVAVGATAAGVGHPKASPSASRSASPSPSGADRSREPSAPASASAPGSRGSAPHTRGHGTGTGAVPLTVGVRPYVYDSPCSQHFLVDSEPAQVGPPAGEQDARRWAGAYGAVSSGEQRIALTVQGTGADTVVLEALHVRFLSKGAPLAWNDYSMGVGCGGGVDSESFDVDLDDGSPAVTVKNGQRDFPYKVSESDPEVFYVTAHSKAHDVRWDLSLEWSSGSRHGTVHIDNDGVPFRTSADVDRPGYDYPLGGGEWIKREE